MSASTLTMECSHPEPHDNSVSLSTQAEDSSLVQSTAAPAKDDQPNESPGNAGTEPKDDSRQTPPAVKERTDHYGRLATRLASRATEEEISFIESQIKGLEARKETLAGLLEQAKNGTAEAQAEQANEESGQAQPVVAIPSLNSVDWDGFVNNTWCDCTDYSAWARENGIQRQPYAIDVLVGNARYFWQREPEPDNQDQGDLPVVPERIRINSRPVLALLANLTVKSDDEPYSKILLRPYKVLVRHEAAIREHARKLGRKWGQLAAMDDGACELEAPDPKAEDDKLEDSAEAWKDMVCLTQFLDECILPAVKMFGRDEVKKVRFQDLWYLFRPGDDILVNNTRKHAGRSTEKHAVWRVFYATGGRPLLHYTGEPFQLWDIRDKTSRFAVTAYRISFNGKSYGTVSKRFTIDPFSGQKDITSLEMYPVRFATNKTTILQDLDESGKKFAELASTSPRDSHRHRNFVGTTVNVDLAGDFCVPAGESVSHVSGQVIVDFEEAVGDDFRWIPTASFPPIVPSSMAECDSTIAHATCWKDADRKEAIAGPHNDVFVIDINIDQQLTERFMAKDKFLSRYKINEDEPNLDSSSLSEKDMLLLPKQVCAFLLKRRAFALLNIDGLEPFVAQERGWTELKLPKGHKVMVEAQAMSHFRDKDQKIQARERDVVQGKGRGLIILLHGFPGVGKTSTAECLAAKLGKPLLPITCGDLGTTVELVEKRLEAIFSKAQKWNCVLLLDEADVFLAERTKTDIERNALVSLFLRTLEYYDGLLFLTTNRVGTLDEAFKSRIHMTLYYPPLKQAQMRAIWEVNLKRIQSYRDDIDPNINDILAFPDELWDEMQQEGRSQWNGRQIRNAFQTALALAENDHFTENPELLSQDQPSVKKIRLEKKHFVTVAKTINTFDDYLGTTHHGSSHSKMAYDRGQRADNYGQRMRQQAAQPYYGYAPPPPPSMPMYGGGPPPSPNAGGNAAAYYAPPPPGPHYSGGYPAAPPQQPSQGMLWPPASMSEVPPTSRQQQSQGQQNQAAVQDQNQRYLHRQAEHPLASRAAEDDEFA